jgi:Kef-type K+ transport system membrane component KefB
MLGLAALAGKLGLAAIIGAFLAGMVLAETSERSELEDQTQPVYDLLVPFFFVVTGSQVDLRVFLQPAILWLVVGVSLLALAGKLIGCGLVALPEGRRRALIIGLGMAPRGEVGLIVASIGRGLGVVPEDIFSVIVAMSIITTLVVPPALALLLRQEPAGAGAPVSTLAADG